MTGGRAEPWAKSILLLDPDKTPGWSPALGGHGVPGGSWSTALEGPETDVQTSKQRPSKLPYSYHLLGYLKADTLLAFH